MYLPLIRPGGLVAFHDIVKTRWEGCEVDRFWSELARERDLNPRAIIGHFRSHWGGIGLVNRPVSLRAVDAAIRAQSLYNQAAQVAMESKECR